jgi:hypothetical protein
MPQPAYFGGFYYDRASYLVAYRAVMAAICQRSPLPLREFQMLAKRLEAKLQYSKKMTDLKTLF